MPRPKKMRRIGMEPAFNRFGPKGVRNAGFINLTVEEFETIRLLDNENMTQEQAAVSMGVARTTVTAIYDLARKKVAEALVTGKTLVIEGGDYILLQEEKMM